ncbi:MAG: MBOAT family protein, partial [Candidatus Hydrogenedentes bacterium]|nr:MBOAT family protein [Candidatus Hydrogenedentota bacterium]
MLFNSYQFLIFFPVVACLHFMLPHRWRWLLLLLASYAFYMAWVPSYIILILVSTLVDYVAAILISRTEVKAKRTAFLMLSLFTNFGLLFTFKYFNFFNESLRVLFDYFGIAYSIPASHFLLPVGISFYTFQTLSYTIEVYRGRQECERRFGIFALYVAFFPQLVAGPIERPQNLLKQFFVRQRFDPARATSGLQLLLWGMFKKVVIADRLALVVDQVYNGDAYSYHGASLYVATFFFAFQIYCDFSGYSDIAIGTARLLGFDLMKNFDRPYSARSIGEFWQRWHISLSTWFRDYVYIPLGGSRVAVPRWYLNLAITFTVSGLWHGANWTFVIWGALHAVYYIASVVFKSRYDALAVRSGLARVPALQHGLERFATFLI